MEVIYIMINTKNIQLRVAANSRRTFVFLYQEHSLTLDMCSDGSMHSCRPMKFYVAWTLIPKSTTPVVPLHHFSRNAKKWAVLKSLGKRTG